MANHLELCIHCLPNFMGAGEQGRVPAYRLRVTVAVNKASISPIRTIGGLRTGSRCPYTFGYILSDIERMFYMYFLPFC